MVFATHPNYCGSPVVNGIVLFASAAAYYVVIALV